MTEDAWSNESLYDDPRQDWWLEFEYWPGPYELPKLDLSALMRSGASGIVIAGPEGVRLHGFAITEEMAVAMGKLRDQIKIYASGIVDLNEAMVKAFHPPLEPTLPALVEKFGDKIRADALHKIKHRNTGPRSDYPFVKRGLESW